MPVWSREGRERYNLPNGPPMNQSGLPGKSAIQLEYEGEVAIIKAPSDLNAEPLDKFEKAMRGLLASGYRLVIIDCFESELKFSEEVVSDIFKAASKAFKQEAEAAIVYPQGYLEWSREHFLNSDPTFDFLFYFSREDAIKALRPG